MSYFTFPSKLFATPTHQNENIMFILTDIPKDFFDGIKISSKNEQGGNIAESN